MFKVAVFLLVRFVRYRQQAKAANSPPRCHSPGKAANPECKTNDPSKAHLDLLGIHLLKASLDGDFEAVQDLIQQGADVNFSLERGRTPLLHAILDKKIVEVLLEHGADPNATMANGATPLHAAVHYKHWETACLLIGYGAKVDATDSIGASPLMRAASIHGDVDMIRLLLFYGADPNVGEPLGKTPLYMALFCGHLEAAHLLLGHGARTNMPELKKGIPPLVIATQKGHVDMIAMLLEYHADVNATTRAGFTALHWACNEDKLETIQTLLAAGANPHATSNNGITPMMIAVEGRRMKIAALVLEALLQRARQNAWPAALRRGLVHTVQVLPSWKDSAHLVRAIAQETIETPPLLRPQFQHLLFVELYGRRGGSWL
eukprot:scaffold337_cov172-Amphora_coffeaeformis.AAC.4